jgi:FkbM family methyltransferase
MRERERERENKINFLILRLKKKFLSKFYKLFNISIKYKYKYFSILLPADHSLPLYSMINKNYDRFLPNLVKHLTYTDTVLDIGANVGDTLASMIEKNAKPNYICIEADDYFYNYLKKNLAIIRKSVKNTKIQIIKTFIGKDIKNIYLEGKDGTKKAIINKNGNIKNLSLDEVIPKETKIRLLKSDVDGFDYDILNSSMNVIKKNKPLIFFEYFLDYQYQRQGYTDVLKKLKKLGYKNWVVFDNFGTVILLSDKLDIIEYLTNYLYLQKINKATRTIYCFDILTFLKKDSKLINKVISNYHPELQII